MIEKRTAYPKKGYAFFVVQKYVKTRNYSFLVSLIKAPPKVLSGGAGFLPYRQDWFRERSS